MKTGSPGRFVLRPTTGRTDGYNTFMCACLQMMDVFVSDELVFDLDAMRLAMALSLTNQMETVASQVPISASIRAKSK